MSHVLSAAGCLLLSAGHLIAQQPLSYPPDRPIPFAKVLADRGIVTDSQVIQALYDKDPMIQGVAACRLAELRLPHAADLIRDAIRVEQNQVVLADLSTALWTLGDPEGRTRLEDLCRQSSPQKEVLMRAAFQLFLRDKGVACTENLTLASLQYGTEGARTQAAEYLENARREAPAVWAATVARVAIQSLNDPSIGVRKDAAALLVRIGTSSGKQQIADALTREHDPNVKAKLEIVLARFPATSAPSAPGDAARPSH